MPVTPADLQQLMLDIGQNPEIVNALKPDAPILKQGLDSADYPEVSLAIEDKYGVKITEEDCAKLCSLNDFVAFLTERGK